MYPRSQTPVVVAIVNSKIAAMLHLCYCLCNFVFFYGLTICNAWWNDVVDLVTVHAFDQVPGARTCYVIIRLRCRTLSVKWWNRLSCPHLLCKKILVVQGRKGNLLSTTGVGWINRPREGGAYRVGVRWGRYCWCLEKPNAGLAWSQHVGLTHLRSTGANQWIIDRDALAGISSQDITGGLTCPQTVDVNGAITGCCRRACCW